jgi:hypothetical protein
MNSCAFKCTYIKTGARARTLQSGPNWGNAKVINTKQAITTLTNKFTKEIITIQNMEGKGKRGRRTTLLVLLVATRRQGSVVSNGRRTKLLGADVL